MGPKWPSCSYAATITLTAAKANRLTTESEFIDYLVVFVNVLALQIIQ